MILGVILTLVGRSQGIKSRVRSTAVDPLLGVKRTPPASDHCVRLYGNAQPGDLHLAADVRAIDDGVLAYITRCKRRRKRRSKRAAAAPAAAGHAAIGKMETDLLPNLRGVGRFRTAKTQTRH
jgi:hypothetical protein